MNIPLRYQFDLLKYRCNRFGQCVDIGKCKSICMIGDGFPLLQEPRLLNKTFLSLSIPIDNAASVTSLL